VDGTVDGNVNVAVDGKRRFCGDPHIHGAGWNPWKLVIKIPRICTPFYMAPEINEVDKGLGNQKRDGVAGLLFLIECPDKRAHNANAGALDSLVKLAENCT